MIFAANSNPVFFCTHRRTTEKAPLKIRRREKMDYWKNSSFLLSSQVGSKLMSVDKSNMDRHDRERDHVSTLLFLIKVVQISNILKCRKNRVLRHCVLAMCKGIHAECAFPLTLLWYYVPVPYGLDTTL